MDAIDWLGVALGSWVALTLFVMTLLWLRKKAHTESHPVGCGFMQMRSSATMFEVLLPSRARLT